jgi:alpha-tubulin suppressor-like RCC1 family protein
VFDMYAAKWPGLVNPPGEVTAAGAGVQSVAVDAYHACFVRADGKVLCFGNNSHGQVDPSQPGGAMPPTEVQGLPAAVTVATGATAITGLDDAEVLLSGSCARRKSGEVWCWGGPFLGPASPAANAKSPATAYPEPLLAGAVAIAKEQYGGGCMIRDDGTAWCWGSDDNGELGRGTAFIAAPAPVAGFLIRREPDFARDAAGLAASESWATSSCPLADAIA